ncbi:MAG: helix-turn-helix transcriptional regulator [Lentisphaerae bacterium]|nr:helix-turn-helix transcriptional regulator [Lentisphaerota bacterium]
MNKTCENLAQTRNLIEQLIGWAEGQPRLPVVYLQEDRGSFRATPAPVLEVSYHSDGSAIDIELGPYRYRSVPGTVLILTDYSGYRATPAGPSSVWNLCLRTETETPVPGVTDRPLLLAAHAALDERLVDRFRVAAYGYRQDRLFQDLQLKCEVLGILIAAAEAMVPTADQPPERSAATIAALRVIDRDCKKPDLARADVARAAHLSEAQLARVFQRDMGVTPMAYLRRVRIDRACRLLRRTELSIEEVGRAVGLPTPAHFSRLFSAVQGQSPRAYRRQL